MTDGAVGDGEGDCGAMVMEDLLLIVADCGGGGWSMVVVVRCCCQNEEEGSSNFWGKLVFGYAGTILEV